MRHPLSLLFPALLPLLLSACAAELEDNSLEAAELTGGDPDAQDYTGALSVAAGAEAGDWELSVGDHSFSLHSPSRADLSVFTGDVTLSVGEAWDLAPSLVLTDAAGVAFVSSHSADEDGSAAFGRSVWTFGEVLGRGVIVNAYDEPNDVTFREVEVTDDNGAQIVLPGEPAEIVLDGVRYRLTVIAAYQPESERNAKCGPPDMLSVEVVRTESPDLAPLVRPSSRRAPMGSCG